MLALRDSSLLPLVGFFCFWFGLTFPRAPLLDPGRIFLLLFSAHFLLALFLGEPRLFACLRHFHVALSLVPSLPPLVCVSYLPQFFCFFLTFVLLAVGVFFCPFLGRAFVFLIAWALFRFLVSLLAILVSCFLFCLLFCLLVCLCDSLLAFYRYKRITFYTVV